MMASLVGVAMKRAGEGRLDKPVALMMGVAAGALVFMMPIALLEQAAVASGLANVLPPAAPPLGLKAQVAGAIAAALIGFGLAYAVMRLLDRASGMFEPEDRPAEVPSEEAPRLRRRDRHPDAPARRPLSAARDLGEPIDHEPAAPRRRAPLALSLTQGEPPAPRMPWERDKADAAIDAPQQQRVRAPLLADVQPEPEPEPEPEPVVRPEPEVEQVQQQPAPLPIEPAAAEASAEQQDERDAEPASDRPDHRAEDDAFEEASAPTPAPVVPAPLPPRAEPARAAHGQESIGELLARLERALDRRTPPRPHHAAETDQPPSGELLEPIDTRLRSALENLKRFAPQRG